MKIVENVRRIKEIHPETIVLIRVGKFYNVYLKDACILSYICDYRINRVGEYYTCGFPISAINKVLRCIELKKISYIVVNKSCNYEVEEKEDYKNENKYKEYYEIASKKIKIINRINAVKSFLNEILENEQMLPKLKQIEEIIHEE